MRGWLLAERFSAVEVLLYGVAMAVANSGHFVAGLLIWIIGVLIISLTAGAR